MHMTAITAEDSFSLALQTAHSEYCLFRSDGKNRNISAQVNTVSENQVREYGNTEIPHEHDVSPIISLHEVN